MRIPAREIEVAVTTRLAEVFADALALMAVAGLEVAPHAMATFVDRCAAAHGAALARNGALVQALVRQVRIHDSRIEIVCNASALASWLEVEAREDAPETLSLPADVRLTRSGMALRLVQSNGAAVAPKTDGSTIRLVAKARRWWGELRAGEMDVEDLATREQVSGSYVTRVLRLAFLAPQVVDAVLAGTTLPHIDAAALTATGAISPDWKEQRLAMLPAPAKGRKNSAPSPRSQVS